MTQKCTQCGEEVKEGEPFWHVNQEDKAHVNCTKSAISRIRQLEATIRELQLLNDGYLEELTGNPQSMQRFWYMPKDQKVFLQQLVM